MDVHRVPDLPAQGGIRVVDLNQSDAGYVEQTFDTIPHARYKVAFWHGVNRRCASRATFDVQIDGQVVQTFSSVSTLAKDEVEFVARADRTTLRFQSTSRSGRAAAIDASA